MEYFLPPPTSYQGLVLPKCVFRREAGKWKRNFNKVVQKRSKNIINQNHLIFGSILLFNLSAHSFNLISGQEAQKNASQKRETLKKNDNTRYLKFFKDNDCLEFVSEKENVIKYERGYLINVSVR